jgi:uncharacterized protein
VDDKDARISSPARRDFLRRDFLKIGGATAAGLVASGIIPASAHAAIPTLPSNPVTANTMPTRNLGKTGYRVGLFSLGGQAAIEQPDNEANAVAIIERALDFGVNYIDTSARYPREGRWSEKYIGKVMKHRRNEAYLASKTHDRTRDGSLKLLEQSLTYLQTDHLDAYQLHAVNTMEDVEKVFAKGGAIEALQQAREQKMVRNLGVTGHFDPEVLSEFLRRFPFDQILMAVNAADKHQKSFIDNLLPLAVEKQVGIVALKIPARSRLLSTWDPKAAGLYPGKENEKPGALLMKDALYYVLSQPVSTVIVGCDSVAQLEENVKLAREFTPLSNAQLAAITARTEPIARQSLFFRKWA